MDHVGGHLAKFQQWDAGKRQWKVASDWIEGVVALSQAIIDEGAEKYAADNGIKKLAILLNKDRWTSKSPLAKSMPLVIECIKPQYRPDDFKLPDYIFETYRHNVI